MTFGIIDDVTDARAKESFEQSEIKRPIAEIGHEGAKWATAYGRARQEA